MNIVCGQTDIAWEDRTATLARVRALVEARGPSPGSLLVLPEMFATGFTMNVDAAADSEDGQTSRFLSQIAERFNCSLMAGVVSREPDGRGWNESVTYGPDGREVGRYRKMRPFVFGESDAYGAGDRTVQLGIGEFQVSPFVCYDLRFPELFRAAARNGTDLFVVIASWPVARIHHWTALLQARAIENQAYVVGVNRVGDDPSFHYSGQSVVVAPGGEILLDCGSDEGLFETEIDLSSLREYRRKLPFLGDMHLDYVRDESKLDVGH